MAAPPTTAELVFLLRKYEQLIVDVQDDENRGEFPCPGCGEVIWPLETSPTNARLEDELRDVREAIYRAGGQHGAPPGAGGAGVPLTFGSLFAGIGGIDLGLERAGMRCAWQVEIDDDAQTILRKHWPDVPKRRDVRFVQAGELEPVDVIAGGFPCQDISLAGRGAGLAGERSGLWREFARIVGDFRPRYVLVENVPALRRRGGDRVLADLAARGFDAEWDCLPAVALGAPHRRDRIFVVAYANGERVREQPERHQRGPAERRDAVAGDHGAHGALAHAYRPGRPGRPDGLRVFGPHAGELLARARSESIAGWWSTEPAVGRVANGLPRRVDRLRLLGNAVVPAVAEFVGRLIVAHAGAAP